MQLTTQTRLKADSAVYAQLSAYAQLYAKRLHALYAWVAARGGKARDHKTEFCHAQGVSARMFNVLAVEVQGLIDGTRELLADRLKDLQKAHKSAQRSLKTAETKLKKLQAKLSWISGLTCGIFDLPPGPGGLCAKRYPDSRLLKPGFQH